MMPRARSPGAARRRRPDNPRCDQGHPLRRWEDSTCCSRSESSFSAVPVQVVLVAIRTSTARAAGEASSASSVADAWFLPRTP